MKSRLTALSEQPPYQRAARVPRIHARGAFSWLATCDVAQRASLRFRREEPFSWLATCVPDASQEKPSSRLDGARRYSFSQER